MRTSLIAASVVLMGATAMAATAPQAKATAKPAATHAMVKAHATGVVEKFDATTQTLTVKHEGKDMQFVIGDSASLLRGKDKVDAAALGSATGQMAKIEYTMMSGTKTADKVELPPAKMTAAKPAPKK